MTPELTAALPMIVGIVGGLIILGGGLAIMRVDLVLIPKTLYCPRCRKKWQAGEKFCPRCETRGGISAAPEHRYPAVYWLPPEVRNTHERDHYGFDEIDTIPMHGVPVPAFRFSQEVDHGE